jgi:ribosomal protein S12
MSNAAGLIGMRRAYTFVLLIISAAAFPSAALAEDANDANMVLSQVAQAMGANNLKTIHYSGTGSSYIVADGSLPTAGWTHAVMKSYVRDINLDAATSRLQLVRIEGTPPVEKTVAHTIDAKSPWSSQYEFWITPYGFLKGAMANKAAVEAKTVFGTTYKAVTFMLPGGHTVTGYIDDKNMIDRVETKIGEKDDVVVEALYRDYSDFNGVKFPTMITEKQGGSLSLILVVKEVNITK